MLNLLTTGTTSLFTLTQERGGLRPWTFWRCQPAAPLPLKHTTNSGLLQVYVICSGEYSHLRETQFLFALMIVFHQESYCNICETYRFIKINKFRKASCSYVFLALKHILIWLISEEFHLLRYDDVCLSCLAYSSILEMEAVWSSETSVNFHLILCYGIPEDRTFHDYYCKIFEYSMTDIYQWADPAKIFCSN